MKKKEENNLLKINNFLLESDKINSSDETFNKLDNQMITINKNTKD